MKRLPGRWYWLALIAMAGLLLLYAEHRGLSAKLTEYRDSEAQAEAKRVERDRAVGEVERLTRQVEQLDSDPVEVEASIRRSKNLVREGETIYRVELPENSQTGKGSS